MKRKKNGQWTRCLNPVAVRQVVIVKPDYHEPPGRHGMDWDEIGKGLMPNAPYDRDMVALVQTMRGNKVDTHGLRGLIDRVCWNLNGERKRRLYDNICSILAAKKQRLDREEMSERKASEHRARRYTKSERRQAGDARKRLKELLRSK